MKLYTRQSPQGEEVISALFGGIRISGRSEGELFAELARVSHLILSELNESDWSVRSYLKYATCKNVDADNPGRVFSGIFGRLLATGAVCSLGCLSKNGAYYQIFYANEKEGRIVESLRKLVSLLIGSRTLQVTQIRDELFPSKPKGSWPKTSLLIDAIRFVGHAEWCDKFSIQRSKGLEYAIRAAAGTRINTGREWLVVQP